GTYESHVNTFIDHAKKAQTGVQTISGNLTGSGTAYGGVDKANKDNFTAIMSNMDAVGNGVAPGWEAYGKTAAITAPGRAGPFGNPQQLSAAADKFDGAGKDIQQLATDLINSCKDELKEWHGDGAEAASAKIQEFAKGLDGTAGNAGGTAQVLRIWGMVAQVVE